MNPAWCALCLGQVTGRDPLAEDIVVSGAFTSQYRGVCSVCDGEIASGDMVCRIRQHPDDPGEVVHDDCANRGELYV
jgi:hypothetical protein